MTYLTEAQVIARLKAAVAAAGSNKAFAKANKTHSSIVNLCLHGQYEGIGKFPPQVLNAIGVRRQIIYEVIEDRKEKAA